MEISDFSYCVHCGHQFVDHPGDDIGYNHCDKIDCHECPGFELDVTREQEAAEEADEVARSEYAEYRCDMAREDN